MKYLLLKVVLLLSVAFVNAQDNPPALEFALSGGYQTADLKWSIAGPENVPDVLSEVKWHRLSGPSADVTLRYHLTRRLFIGGEVAKCFIKGGDATDTDYGDNDRQLPTYQAHLDGDEGHLLTFRLYGGYNLLLRPQWCIAAFAGYAEKKEFLFLLNHAEYVPGQRNLRCTYNTSWKGISGGLSGLYHVTSRLAVSGELQYSQMNYNALADWNLIDAFQHPVSFKHQAKGFDLKASVTGIFRLKRYLSLFMSGTFNHAETGTGIDELFLESGAVQTSQFNGALAHAKKITAGILIRF